MEDQSATTGPRRQTTLRCRAQGEFAKWLANSGGSLLVSTYTSGKLVLITSQNDHVRFRCVPFARPMGIASDGNRLALATQRKILLFGRTSQRRATSYRLRKTYETGKLDAHDLAFGRHGLYFANTRFNCIARATERCRFLHSWHPPFVTEMAYEDRCHLNGLGMQASRPAMATSFSETNHKDGWREQDRFRSGVLIDIRRNEVVARELCMPHSPRWHDGHWWFCNSGLGALCRFDVENGSFEQVCRLPGFTRGLSLLGDHALVGLSKIRKKHVLDSAELHDRPFQARAGVALVNLSTGQAEGMLEFTRGGNEVYEVVFLPGVKRPEVVTPGN